MLNKQQFILIIGLASALVALPAWGNEEIRRQGRQGVLKDTATHLSSNGDNWETNQVASAADLFLTLKGTPSDKDTAESKGLAPKTHIAQGVTRVTGVEVIETNEGLELILNTVAGSERLVPLILPQGNDLIVDILDATLAFSIRNGVTETNPAPGISRITVSKANENSIRVRITGTNQTPSADVVPERDDLVLSVTPEDTTAQKEPDEEIEVIATGEAQAEEEGYVVKDGTTATRTDTPLKDVPQSVQIVPQQVIEDQQAQELQDVTRNVSGVFQGNTFGGVTDQFVIRGFETNVFLRNGFRDQIERTIETANIERVEVLKGPASVLHGTLEPGGIINIVTKKPLEDPLYSAELTVGSFNTVEPSIDLSGPLNEDKTLLYRFNALYENRDVFRDFDENVERIFVAPSLTWKIGDRTDITFNFEYLNDERPFDRGLVAFGDGIADIPFDRVLGEPDDFSERENFDVSYLLEHRFSDNWKLRNNFRFGSSDSSESYLEFGELDESTGNLTRLFIENENTTIEDYALQTNIVGEFATGSVEHTLLFGIDLFRNTFAFNGAFGDAPELNIFNPENDVASQPELEELSNLVSEDNREDSLGIYLQDQIKFSEQWQLLLGGRFDIVDQESDSGFNGEISSSELQDEAFSPRLGVVYQPIEPLSLYASFTQSFSPNSSIDESGELLEPERGTQYEVGIKGELFDGDLSTTLAAFNINKTNIAIPDPILENVSRPIGEQRSRGIELDVRGEILPGWNVITSYTYTDAEVTEDEGSEAEGNRLFGVPENAVSLWTTYEIQNGDLQGLGFSAGLFFVGEREGDLDNSFQVPSYTRTDTSIFYQKDNWRAAVNFKNLFDIDYIQSASRRTRINPGIPFTVLGTVSVEF